MKKYISIIIFNFLISNCVAQSGYHNVFVGTNLTATYLTDAKKGHMNSNTFKDPTIGFSVGYKYVQPIIKTISISAGLEFTNIKTQFKRGIVTGNSPLDNIYPSGTENFKFSRLSIPVQGYFNFVNKERYKFYVTLGAKFIFLNKVNRTTDYYILFPPATFTKFTYTGKQNVKFGENEKSVDIAIVSGIGSEFSIKGRNFTVELTNCDDQAGGRLLTLHNIETTDSYFFCRFNSLQLKLGTSFSLRRGDKKSIK